MCIIIIFVVEKIIKYKKKLDQEYPQQNKLIIQTKRNGIKVCLSSSVLDHFCEV